MSRDKSLQDLFNEALEKEDALERGRFLDEACRADAVLRERIEKLVRAHDEAGGFFSQPSKAPRPVDASGAVASPITEKSGDRVGRYKLLQQIGEGGCGVVYMAEQEEPVRRRVALKVIKLGMDTKQVIARFEAERQALALMDHPHIAKVLDAGATNAGRSYFVMELVRGVKITEYCDENKVATADRLKLFIHVCQAIQHAHQKGVIHRDIKPSNILVTTVDGVAMPKVIDFGIAKATSNQLLTDKTLFTAFEQFIGTPAYMSPEQAEMSGVDIDTRSDIYSLGVLLYELLTGGPPFDQTELLAAGLDGMRRTIREEEPPRPSTRLRTMRADALTTTAQRRRTEPTKLVHLTRGDLDWIVMKCLEKDRARRYQTANALARDLDRHLNNEPVDASPPGAGYRLSKLIKRNKGRAAATGLVLVALLAGIAGMTWGMVRAERARQDAVLAQQAEAERAAGERRAKEEAQARLAQIEAGTEILASVFRDADPIAAEKAGVTSQDLLSRRLAEAASQLEGEAVGDPLVVARLQHLLGTSLRELGHLEQAEAVLVKSCHTRERLLGTNHLDTVATKHALARLYCSQKKSALAEALLNEVLAVRTAKLGSDHLDTLATKHQLAVAYNSPDQYALGESLCKEVLILRTAKLGAEHLDSLATKHRLAVLYRLQGKYDLAEQMFKEILPIRTAKLGADHPDNLYTKQNLGILYVAQGKEALAESFLREVMEVHIAKQGVEYSVSQGSHTELAKLYRKLGKFTLAEPLYKEIYSVRAATLGDNHADTISSLWDLAVINRRLKRLDQATTLLEETYQRAKATQHRSTLEIQAHLGARYSDSGRLPEALTLLEGVQQVRDKPGMDWVGEALLTCYVRAAKAPETIALAHELIGEARERLPADSVELAAALTPPGQALRQAEQYAEAEPLLLFGFQGLKQAEARSPLQVDWRLRNVVEQLIVLYDAWGKPDEAAKWRQARGSREAKQQEKPKGP